MAPNLPPQSATLGGMHIPEVGQFRFWGQQDGGGEAEVGHFYRLNTPRQITALRLLLPAPRRRDRAELRG